MKYWGKRAFCASVGIPIVFMLHAMGAPHVERSFLVYEIYRKGVLRLSGHFPQKWFENEFMRFQVLMGRESYDILELT